MKKSLFTGSGVAIVTPMREDKSIDYESLFRLLQMHLENQTDAVVVAGTTGEASTLSMKEYRRLVEFTVSCVGHRKPVIAGAGSNNTAYACRLVQAATEAGADACLMVTPYYNKCSQKGLAAHYRECAKYTQLPFILYNVPGRTGVNILPDTYERLLEIPNVQAVKEASGSLAQIRRLKERYGDRLDIYVGNDDQIFEALSLGAAGVISVLANLCPKAVHQLCQTFLEGDRERSRSLQERYLDLARALFLDVNPIPVKYAMNLLGMQAGPCRLPLCEMEEEPAGSLAKILAEYFPEGTGGIPAS